MELTDWHRLFGMALTDYFTGTSYTVETEKDLSLKKQRLDVVIIEKSEGEPPAELPDGLENMAAHNLLSFKSLREPFDDWTADELTGHFVNYRKQISPSLKKLLPKADFRLYGISTRFPKKLAKQINLKPVKKGVYELRWGVRDIRLIVTRQIPKEKRNALWLMFSAAEEKIRYGVSEYTGRLDEMSSVIRQMLVKYRTEGVIAMPYTIEDYRKELEQNVLKSLTPEDVLENFSPDELLAKISPEHRLRGLPAEERLKGLPAEERLKGLSDEELLKRFSAEEIEAYLQKLKKKRTRKRRTSNPNGSSRKI